MTIKSFFKWSDDLAVRRDSLRAFADSSKAVADKDGFVWGDGQYLILHFDLMNLGPAGPINARSTVYDAISSCVEQFQGTRLGGSVYIAPLLPSISSERHAAVFWNNLCDTLAGQLR